MKIFLRKLFLLVVVLLTITSCVSPKKMVYMQNIESQVNSEKALSFEPTLQPDDLLSIIISAETPEVTIPFNLPQIQGNYDIGNNQNGIKTYLIDSNGNIEFPVVGTIKLGGLTRTQANTKLVEAVGEYVTKPSVNLRILNYKISVLGEVVKPGTFNISSERITMLEAISMAGDLTIYGKRNNILLMRDSEGKKTFTRIDITKADFINSEYYYLSQNDVIVVEPNKTRINASAVGPNLSIIISALSVLTTVIVILTRN